MQLIYNISIIYNASLALLKAQFTQKNVSFQLFAFVCH